MHTIANMALDQRAEMAMWGQPTWFAFVLAIAGGARAQHGRLHRRCTAKALALRHGTRVQI